MVFTRGLSVKEGSGERQAEKVDRDQIIVLHALLKSLGFVLQGLREV